MTTYKTKRPTPRRALFYAFWMVFLLFVLASPAQAYIGPGAGFAFISSLLTLVISFLLAFFALLVLPVRLLFSFLRGGAGFADAKVKRVIILGFDGMDPQLCASYMQQGLLPNLSRLKKEGSFLALQTTCPSLSPVAWSSFATGVNPAKHRIYDFLHRHPATYLPELSSYRVHEPKKKIVLGDWQIPLQRPKIELTRKSQSFWKILGERAVFSQIIRVPLTFPPEKFNGHLLSAMCTPDLLGSQGSFAFYTSEKNQAASYTNGVCMPLEKSDRGYTGHLIGPPDSSRRTPRSLTLDFHLARQDGDGMELRVNGIKYQLQNEKLTPWIPLTFKSGLLKIHGICQMLLKATEPQVQLYVSPLHIDPERPAMPISHPVTYSTYLAKLLG
ncbi:alkaline phosphatase family protein, partial [candidate division KSB1 bacterium]